MKKSIESVLLDRIYYIGDDLPKVSENDKRPKFVLLGTPQEVINETINKRFDEWVKWIAEYSYRKANPESKMDTPSIVYEQVERDLEKFLASNN